MEEVPVILTIVIGPNVGQEYELESDEITIGRSANNSIVLPLPEISRRHARILRDGEAYFIEDLGSTNGTFVNNRRLQAPVRLNDGDEVQVGDALVMRFGGTADVAMPAAQAAVANAIARQADTLDEAGEVPTGLATSEPAPDEVSQLNAIQMQLEQWLADDPQRAYFVGLGSLFILLVACFSLAFFLDAYEEGRLLYCGGLRPVFELVLGPVGFNPVCP